MESVGRGDYVFAAEKSRSVNPDFVIEILKAASSHEATKGSRLALIVYSDRALPLVDYSEAREAIPLAYLSAPVLGKGSDPVAALLEAWEMIGDLSLPPRRDRLILIWSASSRPKARFDLIVRFLEEMGVRVSIVALRPSMPGWIKHFPHSLDLIHTVRSTTSPRRLVDRLLSGDAG